MRMMLIILIFASGIGIIRFIGTYSHIGIFYFSGGSAFFNAMRRTSSQTLL